ncbi:hypothetical protein CAEBREN_14081 [Caenorhabditis brenneri]|uniref:Uncharacterized protein n=1 Tax=Caenorhabditis brenneri TaxID=135651 RepID=G0MAR3_CAEBE|nr:hypothetical protein CAEBREN_14081 [Caenorhabditis brenneri]
MPYPSSLCSENEMEELSAKKARKLKRKKQKRKVRFELVEKKKNKRNKKKKEKTVVHISTDSNDDEGPGVYEHYITRTLFLVFALTAFGLAFNYIVEHFIHYK